ncbi:phosphoenolpyruvate carboxylase kinase 1-like [Humulus lupulus]|uniref:phosphoenolpyruvate carboxylase kinase 1-like n=1 Tax=Humulus lupulus TaxID=3486 RepID=UPI002B412AF2|nr:phosphoenolpyruvate carboxylase kinase 1-like [Humulus lupulus]
MTDGLKRDYQILEEIGQGRFGTVYRCSSANQNGGFFAVKSIEKRLVSGDSLESQCLLTEPKILHHVSDHPNIVKLHNLYEDDSYLDMVLDLCDSADLHSRVSRRVFTETEAASVMTQLMQAVAHCHRHGVAHRDIKPENILFDERNRLKLADFGSAEMFLDGEPMSGIVGTPYYVAPEVLAGRDYNEKVDVWSAGVVLYILLAGFPPFYGESVVETFDAVLRANLRFPTRVFRSVSPAAKDLLRRMLCKDVSRRFSAEQVLRHPWMANGGERLDLSE